MVSPRQAFSTATLEVDDTIPACLLTASRLRPAWLLTPYAANTWIVRDTGHKPDRTLRFDIGLPSGGRLSEAPTLLETVKRVIFGTRHGPLMRVESGYVQAERTHSLLLLVRWMDINRIARFSDLTTADQWEYAHLAVGGLHEILNTEGILANHLQTLSARAGFTEADTREQRRQKALQVLPLRKHGSGGLGLDRSGLLSGAGLEGIGLAGNSPLIQMLDDFELDCGLGIWTYVQRRAAQRIDVDDVERKPLTTESIRRLLMPFALLHEHRRYLDDALNAPPFQGQALKNIAKRLGSEIGRTKTIPVKQGATFIERSVRWVLDYAPRILAVKEAIDEGRQPEQPMTSAPVDAPSTPFPLRTGNRNERLDDITLRGIRPVAPGTGMSLQTALPYLITACGIVIAAFSARRAAEVVGLQTNCIQRDDLRKPWLGSFIHKTLQTHGTVPVPEVVASAVAVLTRLRERARRITGTPYLFQYNVLGTDTVRGMSRSSVPVFPLASFTREFGYFVDVPPLADGTRWTFHPHQFRRFFAVLYVWCYELADWGALAHHLRHFNLEMTRRYVTDAELGGILHQANRERTAQILAAVTLGNAPLAGIGGTRLQEALRSLTARLVHRVQVVPERKIHQRILRFVDRADVHLKALPWGYCASPHASAGEARCTGGCGPATPSEATVSTCLECSRNVRTAEFRPYLERTLARHRALADSPQAPPMLRRASDALCQDIADYLSTLPAGPKVSEKAP
jgi:integrase